MSIQNIRRSVLIVAGAAALAVGGLLAGRLAAGVMPGDTPGGSGPGHVFARIAKALDLSDDQKARAKAILKSHASEIEAQLDAARQARRTLHDAVRKQPLDETAIRESAKELGRIHGEGGILFAKIHAEIDPILNDGQRARLETYREKMRSRSDRFARSLHDFLESETP